jgi:hypothetical protein
MDDKLSQAIRSLDDFLKQHRFAVGDVRLWQGGSCSVDCDSRAYIGSIANWPDALFEFLFLDARNGNVVVLETKEFSQQRDLEAFLRRLISERLS